MKALSLPASGPIEIIDVDPDYRKLAMVIGNDAELVQQVRTQIPDVVMIVDEEGLYHDGELNVRARAFYPGPIKGNAILLGVTFGDDGEEWTDLPDDIADAITEILKQVFG